MNARTCLLLVATVLLGLMLAVPSTEAYPSGGVRSHRQKRVSDQRLAELQTMLALLKYSKGNIGNYPKGKHIGFVDTALIGRKKRSQTVANEYTLDASFDDYADADDDAADDAIAETRRYLRRRLSDISTYQH